MRKYIGIDPGKSGAIVVLGETIETSSFPKIGKEYDIEKMNLYFSSLSGIDCIVGIENVMALPRPLDKGNWSLSRGKAILESLCVANKVPYVLIHSKTWQKVMFEGVPEQRGPSKKVTKKLKDGTTETITKKGKKDTKAMALISAKRRFPAVDLRDPDRATDRAKSAHDGVVDALLIAGYLKVMNL